MAAGREPVDGGQERAGTFLLLEPAGGVLGADVEHRFVGEIDPLVPSKRAQALAAGRHDEPPRQAVRVGQSIEVFDQAEPDRLADVGGVGVPEPVGARHRPHEGREPVDELFPRGGVTAGRSTHEVAGMSLVRHLANGRDGPSTDGGLMKPTSTPEERLLERRDVRVHDAPGQEYGYVPGVILVDDRDLELVAGAIDEAGGHQAKGSAVEGVTRFEFDDPDADVPGIVARLRALPADRTPRVGPSHLLFGFPRMRGMPGDDAEPAPPLGEPPTGKELPAAGVTIVVIDTGLDEGARQHPWLRDVDAEDPVDIDLSADLAPQDGLIDDQAGHGAFVAGLIRQGAPGARVRIVRALDTMGVTEELAVAKAIDRAASFGADIINLSLGGYTDGDVAPLAVMAALARLPRTTAVVVAAGNFGSSRPTWPAAAKRVVSVGAVDAKGRTAAFSNWGWWVDTCAEGVSLHSVYVSGEENPDADRSSPDTFDGHAFWSGTSFACPRVSARIAVDMAREGISARAAAHRLLEDPAATEVPGLGVLVET